MVRVMIVDDSSTARLLLEGLLGADPEIEVVAQAGSGREAIQMAAMVRPDVVTMDILMPDMDGFEACREIMNRSPVPIVVVTAGTGEGEGDSAMRALEAGALTVLQKLGGPSTTDFEGARRDFISTIKTMARVRVNGRLPKSHNQQDSSSGSGKPRPRIVAIGASTGGPQAIRALLSSLSPNFPLPVLYVQHISPGFTERFAHWLGKASPLRVKLASPHEKLEAGTVYLAPEGSHLGVSKAGRIELSEGPPVGGFRPAATRLFSSVAQAYGADMVAVILSGMGRDGLEGLRSVRTAGGTIIAQCKESSIVFGMPGAAIEAGLTKAICSPDEIGYRLQNLARRAVSFENTEHRRKP